MQRRLSGVVQAKNNRIVTRRNAEYRQCRMDIKTGGGLFFQALDGGKECRFQTLFPLGLKPERTIQQRQRRIDAPRNTVQEADLR